MVFVSPRSGFVQQSRQLGLHKAASLRYAAFDIRLRKALELKDMSEAALAFNRSIKDADELLARFDDEKTSSSIQFEEMRMKLLASISMLLLVASGAHAENSILGKWNDKSDPSAHQFEFVKGHDFIYIHRWTYQGQAKSSKSVGVIVRYIFPNEGVT